MNANNKIEFSKYQGAGNDFIMIDNFSSNYDFLTVREIAQLCDRRFGIGADGLILINSSALADFEVDYYNSDGSKSFCGNGARCSVAFVNRFILPTKTSYTFAAIDGLHTGEMINDLVQIDMKPVSSIEVLGDLCFELHTGSPHYIQFDKLIDEKDIVELGKTIRYSDQYKVEGINVNWVEVLDQNKIKIRTYERGVEDETLACGTGVTAAALAYHFKFQENKTQNKIDIEAVGGHLNVVFDYNRVNGFSNIYLIGPATFVFNGEAYVG